MVFTDSHCHLGADEAGTAALQRARQAGVAGFVVPATKLDDAAGVVALAQGQPNVWAAVGFHPHEARHCDADAFSEIELLASDPAVVAIGEIGLDYHYDHSPRETQRAVFRQHLSLALGRDLPVIIHNRESTADLESILGSAEFRDSRGVLHSFTENYEVASRLIDLGFFISFSGILTFRSAENLRECARRLPRDRVLIETDTPYLAPTPYRGKDNEPAWVVRVAEQLAELWEMKLEDVAVQTTKNFEQAFGVSVSW